MRSALLSVGTALVLGGVLFLVHFLGIPARGEPLQAGVRYRQMNANGLGAVRGLVVNRRGHALAGVRVVATSPAPLESFREAQIQGPGEALSEARTDPDGGFLLMGLEPGTIRIWAGDGTWLYGMTRPVEVRPGQVCSGITLALEPRPASLGD